MRTASCTCGRKTAGSGTGRSLTSRRKTSSHLLSEISQLDGSSTPFFCGPGSTTSKCTAPDVIVQNVTPSDPAVITAYNQQVAAQAGTARLAAAKEIYGSDANYFLGVQDMINACHAAGTTCNIYVGNPPAAP